MSATQVGGRRPVGVHAVVCRPAGTPVELEQHRLIRHRVFVVEQGIFEGSDRDEHDEDEGVVCLLGLCDGAPVGAVRLYELDHATGLWQGDRLAVLPESRTGGVGAPLVRCAVATAGARGGREMVAHIQLSNVVFFTRLGWVPDGGPETYAGLPHQRMRIALPDRERGAVAAADLARGG